MPQLIVRYNVFQIPSNERNSLGLEQLHSVLINQSCSQRHESRFDFTIEECDVDLAICALFENVGCHPRTNGMMAAYNSADCSDNKTEQECDMTFSSRFNSH
jgi:hypothetical protein